MATCGPKSHLILVPMRRAARLLLSAAILTPAAIVSAQGPFPATSTAASGSRTADLVTRYLDGRLDVRFLRGRTSLPHVVQAALHYARAEFGDDRIVAYAPVEVDPGDGTTRVVLACDGGSIEVTVREGMSEPLLSQCSATTPGRVRTYELEGISRSGRGAVDGGNLPPVGPVHDRAE